MGFVFGTDFFAESLGFSAKNQSIAEMVLDIGVFSRRFGGKEKHVFGGEQGFDAVKIGMDEESDVGPVVESSAFELFVVELKSDGFDEVENRVGAGAESGDGARVGRDFRLVQDNVKMGIHEFPVQGIRRCDGDGHGFAL